MCFPIADQTSLLTPSGACHPVHNSKNRSRCSRQAVRRILQQAAGRDERASEPASQPARVAHLQSVVAQTTDAGRSGGCAVCFPELSQMIAHSLVLFTSVCRAAPTSFFCSRTDVVVGASNCCLNYYFFLLFVLLFFRLVCGWHDFLLDFPAIAF